MFTKRMFAVLVLLLASAPLLAGPPVESWRTSGGAKVMYVHAPDLPILDVRVVFDAGSARDGGKPGVATLTNALLTEGAGPWSADQLAERLEDRGIELGNDSLRDMAFDRLRSLTDPEVVSVALDALGKVIAAPRFEPRDLERQRQLMLVALSRQKENPGDVASVTFYRALYGEHPYAHDPLGDPGAVEALTREDVIAFHSKFYVVRNAVIAIVGDVDRATAERIAEDLMSELPPGEPAPPLPSVDGHEGDTLRVEFDATQTHVRIGVPGMARLDPDYFALYVGNHILGGNGLVSTLSQEVREKRGLSYSVYSYFLPMRVPGPFLMGAQTRNDRANETLEVMRSTLRQFVLEGPSAEELEAAKRNLTGGFPLRVSSNRKIGEYIAMMGFYDYPLDYLDTFVDRVNAVTADDILAAFRGRIDPAQLVVVTVGGSA
jgi:zinc protease